jgi:hypothetical protein
MRTASRVAVLMAILALALAPAASAASAAIDYSMNSAGGDYAPPVASSSDTSVADDAGFAWGDAAVGAGAAIAVVLVVIGIRAGVDTRRVRREPA